MSRLIPLIQIVLGLSGAALSGWLFVASNKPVARLLQSTARLSAATNVEFSVALAVSQELALLSQQMEKLGTQNLESVRNGQLVLDRWVAGLQQWQIQLNSLSETANQAGFSCERFARVLPLELPVLSYQLETLQIDIPKISIKDQTVELPYPTAQVGSRKETVDLGVTKVNFTLPTLEIGANAKKVTLPSKPEVNIEVRKIEYPKDFKINQLPLFAEEKQVLQRMHSDLQNIAQNFTTSAQSLAELEQLSDSDLRRSLQLSSQAISMSIEQLGEISREHLPEFQNRISEQQQQLNSASSQFSELIQFLPWLWGLLGMLSLGTMLNGVRDWNQLNSNTSPS